jgi:hypothetical protein
MTASRRKPATEVDVPACWSWKVDELSASKAIWYSSPSWSSDPKARFQACKMVLEDWQESRCAICARSPRAMGPNARRRYVRQLLVDHDHSTGLIRGLLCAGCNNAEGRASTKAARYVGYRERPPAFILKMSVPYFSSFQNYRLDRRNSDG